MTSEQIWMRDPVVQCEEEILFYREIFEFVIGDVMNIQHENIMAEGAAFLPELTREMAVASTKYISITPSKQFQVVNYRKRPWVPKVLEGCSDKEQAFRNWMDRDALFAEEVRRQCQKEQYKSVVNDGSRSLDALIELVCDHFRK